MVATPGSRSDSDFGGTRNRVCPIQPAWEGFSYGQDRRKREVREHRFSQYSASLYARSFKGESGADRFAWPHRGAEEGDTGADRARLAAGPEAVDGSNPRHHEARSLG